LGAANAKWRTEDALPGKGRILAAGASFDGKFWIAGGAELVPGKGGKVERRYLADAHFHQPTKGWGRAPALPAPAVGAPSPAPADATGFYVLGGDDGSQLTAPPARHPGFSNKALRFDAKKGEWVGAGELAAPRVTVPVVEWDGAWVVPSGEARPGVRSPEVWRRRAAQNEK
ncbi:MAG: galactose oxidase, partial [Gemmata sp.]